MRRGEVLKELRGWENDEMLFFAVELGDLSVKDRLVFLVSGDFGRKARARACFALPRVSPLTPTGAKFIRSLRERVHG